MTPHELNIFWLSQIHFAVAKSIPLGADAFRLPGVTTKSRKRRPKEIRLPAKLASQKKTITLGRKNQPKPLKSSGKKKTKPGVLMLCRSTLKATPEKSGLLFEALMAELRS